MKGIIEIDMPKSCSECFYENYCVARDNANVNGFKTWLKRPPKCPIKEEKDERK